MGNVLHCMKLLCAVAGAALLACGITGWGETTVRCGESLDAPLHPHGSLTIDSRPAGIEVVGTDKDTVHVTCSAEDTESAEHVKLRFAGGSGTGKLTISGDHAPHNNLKIRVEVPRRTNLRVTMPAGQVNVDDVDGDKDIDLYAGQITISSSHEWDYRRVEASVDIGQVNASAYGVNKGGFFRSFSRKSKDGEYVLRAHVMTGQIDLVSPNGRVAAE